MQGQLHSLTCACPSANSLQFERLQALVEARVALDKDAQLFCRAEGMAVVRLRPILQSALQTYWMPL